MEKLNKENKQKAKIELKKKREELLKQRKLKLKQLKDATKEAKKEYKYIEKCENCRCWRGVYIELCSDDEDSISEPSYGDENFYVKDIQIPIYKKSDKNGFAKHW